MKPSITVLGAGAVGTATAIHLQQRGWQVTLVDRDAPGRQTSFGNAGIIDSGSMTPFNSPDLWAALPGLLLGRGAELRVGLPWLLRHLPWSLRFLAASRASSATSTSDALAALTLAAADEHRALAQRTGNGRRLVDGGWLKVYRKARRPGAEDFETRTWRRHGVPFRRLGRGELSALEPDLAPIFDHGILLADALRVDDPGALIGEHAARFAADGGTLRRLAVDAVVRLPRGGFGLEGAGHRHETSRLVIAAGPWSADVLAPLGYRVPLIVERGYHRHFRLAEGVSLDHVVHDADAAYVMNPMSAGLRVTTGVELAERDAPARDTQLELVSARVREAIAIAGPAGLPDWRGARPTLPDSRPAIGALPGDPGLWAAFGHQHIGLMTGPVSGKLLAQAISGEATDIDLTLFDPARCIRAARSRRDDR